MTGQRNEPASETILIVEDHEPSMRLFSDLLETRGYRILKARDGSEGLELARPLSSGLDPFESPPARYLRPRDSEVDQV